MSNKSAIEKAVPAADWKTDSGKMYSELSGVEKIQYRQNESATERTARETAESQRESQVATAKREQFETESASKQVEVYNRHKQDASKEQIESQTAKFQEDDRQRKVGGSSLANDYSKNFQTQSSLTDKTTKITNASARSAVDEFFKGIGTKAQAETRNQNATEQTNKETVKSSIGDFFSNIIEGIKSDAKLKSDSNPVITPPAIQMSDFNISDMLPDFSGIDEMIGEGLTTIQTAWNELPGFFGGIFSGLGGVASSAGSAIASGLNSGIGIIKSAWESLSGWLSNKISSLSSMASNAVSSITSAVSVGHNATGTKSWRGGWTEINEQGGEIIYLPSGAKIYPHATTMKMLQSEMEAGHFDNLIQSSDELGNLKGYSGMADNLIQAGDLSPIREAKLQKQREEMLQPSIFSQSFQPAEFSTFPQPISFEEMTSGVTNSTSTTTKNNGVTVTGNTFNIRKEDDIDKIAFKLMELMLDGNANFAGA